MVRLNAFADRTSLRRDALDLAQEARERRAKALTNTIAGLYDAVAQEADRIAGAAMRASDVRLAQLQRRAALLENKLDGVTEEERDTRDERARAEMDAAFDDSDDDLIYEQEAGK